MISAIKEIINDYLKLTDSELDTDQLLELLPTDVFCPLTLVERYLEVGGCLFGNEVFEEELFTVFDSWLINDWEVKTSMYARALLEKLPDNADPKYRQWLTDYAEGKRIDRHGSSSCFWPGHPDVYLENWNFPMHEYSQYLQDMKKMMWDYKLREATYKEAIAA